MSPRSIDGWEEPRTARNQAWRYEYYKIIGQIELKLSSNGEPQDRFEGRIFDSRDRRNQCVMHITYVPNDQRWICFGADNTVQPIPNFHQEFQDLNELADFMESTARAIEESRSTG